MRRHRDLTGCFRCEQTSERWPAEMTAEQKKDLIDLDDLRGELDDLAHWTPVSTEAVDELRGRSRS